MDRYLDRTAGRPARKVKPVTPHQSKFVMMTKDGQEVDMVPPQTAEQALAVAAAPPGRPLATTR